MAVTIIIVSCKKNTTDSPYPNSKIEVAKSEIVYNTELNNRIGYTLKTWEYEKDGLKLIKVEAIDKSSDEVLYEINAEDFRRIYKEPIPTNEFLEWDKLDSYYMSLQLPIPLNENIPEIIYHRLYFNDTINDKVVNIDGGEFSPRTDEKPLIINPPLKGDNLIFANQSTSTYHFDVLIFLDGGLYTPERFAFDELEFAPDWSDVFSGNPDTNKSYFNYGDTLYAVADGEIVEKIDGRIENHGAQQDVVFNTDNEYAGNYLILKIADEQYAFYCHIIPGSFMVEKGENVTVGQPIALLGNSGNSSAPHLHFHIADGTDFWKSNGIPFVFNSYNKIGDMENGPGTPIQIENAMMEQLSIVNIDF